MIVIDTANHIAALAAKMARPKVAAAYPITPQTTIVERLAQYVEQADVDMEYIRVESEHSAMTACIGAAATGVRTFTATASHGLLLMHEMLHWAGLARLPIVMVNVNRAIGPGWNIWSDLNDAMSQRDTGWIQFYASSNQEVFDGVIQAYKIAEHHDVLLPAMVSYDGFILSHTSMPVDVPDQKEIDAFLPEFKPGWRIDVENPITHGNIVPPEPYMEIRYSMQRAMEKAKRVIEEVGKEYGERFGRYYGLVEEYRCDDADYVIVTMAALAAEAHFAVDRLRERGEKVGLVNLRTFRPFPYEKLNYDHMIVIDRDISPGLGGVLAHEMKALPGEVYGFVAGLGGVDVTYKDIERIYALAREGKQGWYPTEVK
ncbi:MAG TPA: pyruvate ferredoxin oxidoreductase [Thermoplasmatales archaeon]|nr:MAG: pyruvate ferredoxin oxidoreductase [Thermoplasmata archaeon]HDN51059.1 pyruvate ferredoxin oxidoreductase [Thermoplasmatales archaeon]